MTRRGKVWVAAFLGVTALAIGMELWAINDHDPDTAPWTDLAIRYLPEELVYALIGALMLWLPIHFWVRFQKRKKARQAAERPPPVP